MNGTLTTRYECIITGCTWHHDSPDVPAGPWPWKGSIEATVGAVSLDRAKTDNEAIRGHFETHSLEEWAREVASLREQLHVAPADGAPIVVQPDIQALPCTGCVIDAKQAAMLGRDIPEPLPGTVMVNGMLLCDVRHTLNVGAPQLLVAQPGQMPGLG